MILDQTEFYYSEALESDHAECEIGILDAVVEENKSFECTKMLGST